MNDSAPKAFNTRIGLVVIVLVAVAVIIIYFHSRSSTPITSAVPVTTSTTTTQTGNNASVTTQTQGTGSLVMTTTNQQEETYATYALKNPNQLPITQYPTAYGVELDFVATGSPLLPNLCLKVASDVPIKAFSIPNHANDASTTIPTAKYGGAYEGITCFSGGITSEEDTTVYFNEKPSQINSSLSASNVL
jgi:hypothetical protein